MDRKSHQLTLIFDDAETVHHSFFWGSNYPGKTFTGFFWNRSNSPFFFSRSTVFFSISGKFNFPVTGRFLSAGGGNFFEELPKFHILYKFQVGYGGFDVSAIMRVFPKIFGPARPRLSSQPSWVLGSNSPGNKFTVFFGNRSNSPGFLGKTR